MGERERKEGRKPQLACWLEIYPSLFSSIRPPPRLNLAQLWISNSTADHIHLLGWGNLVLRASVSHDDVVLLVPSQAQQVQRGHFNLVKPTPFRRSPSTPRSRSIGERTDTLISRSRGRRARSLARCSSLPPSSYSLGRSTTDRMEVERDRKTFLRLPMPPSLPPSLLYLFLPFFLQSSKLSTFSRRIFTFRLRRRSPQKFARNERTVMRRASPSEH